MTQVDLRVEVLQHELISQGWWCYDTSRSECGGGVTTRVDLRGGGVTTRVDLRGGVVQHELI